MAGGWKLICGGSASVGDMMSEIIAEIGINHQGDLNKAKLMIDKAKQAGADVAKFQLYRPEKILGTNSPFLAEAKACQFSWPQHLELKRHCDKAGIEWLVSLFHAEHVEPAVDAGMRRFKVASRAALDDVLLREIAKTGKPVIISNGMCDEKRLSAIDDILGKEKTCLYCVCRYPAMPEDFEFERMFELKRHGAKIGLSSHCPSIAPAAEALCLGADVIEQHVVLDPVQNGCDVSSSITFEQLEHLVELAKNDLKLVEITTDEQVEWIRQKRNLPEQYKYFRQDAPITVEQQRRWWRTLDKTRVKLFIVQDSNETRIGYVGFNPLNRGAKTAEFGIFILKEHQGRGLGRQAMRQLLRYGFETLDLSSIYSDTLNYPDDSRWDFFSKLGFAAYPKEHQQIFYRKNGKTIPAIKFFMTRDMWNDHRGGTHGQNDHDRLEFSGPQAALKV